MLLRDGRVVLIDVAGHRLTLNGRGLHTIEQRRQQLRSWLTCPLGLFDVQDDIAEPVTGQPVVQRHLIHAYEFPSAIFRSVGKALSARQYKRGQTLVVAEINVSWVDRIDG